MANESSNKTENSNTHKLLEMLELQERMNQRVHPEWRTQGFQWYRAIWTECAELMDHHGWKWWKKQDPDMPQIQLELVDIWHFGLSYLLTQNDDKAAIASRIESDFKASPTAASSVDFLQAVEALAQQTLSTQAFDVSQFAPLMTLVDMNLDLLYRRYIGKNVLNFFRQDHGYKDGSYQKMWHGKEDNECLAEICEQLNSESESFADDVYAGLKAQYPS